MVLENMAEKNLRNIPQVRVLSKEEFMELTEDLPFKSRLEDCLQYVPYCKVEVYAQCILGALRIPDKKKLEGMPQILGYYVKKDIVILVCQESSQEWILEKIRKIKQIIVSGEKYFPESQEIQMLLLLFHCFIEQEVPYLQKFEEQITELEHILLEEASREFPWILMQLRKNIMKLRNCYVQLIDIGEELQGGYSQLISKEQAGEWAVFTNRVSRLRDYTENIRENLLQLHELYQAQTDLKQNEIMAVLTMVTTIFMPLSLLAGWYGMNFSNMLLLNWKYGYLTLMILTCFVICLELFYFYRKGFFKRVIKKLDKNQQLIK